MKWGTAISIAERFKRAGIMPGHVSIQAKQGDRFHVEINLGRVVFIVNTLATEADIRVIEDAAFELQTSV